MTKSKYQANDKYQMPNDQKESGLIRQEMWRVKLRTFAFGIRALTFDIRLSAYPKTGGSLPGHIGKIRSSGPGYFTYTIPQSGRVL